ncbi:hypothetical protein GCM10028801_41180 [Nocardioides maradonensis]
MTNQTYSTNPSLSNGQITVDYLMNNPVILYRALRTLVQQRLVGGRLLTGRVDLTGTGSAVFETNESIFSADDAEIIDQLGEYPLTDTSGATTSIAASLKRGFASMVSDEDVARNRTDIVQRKLIKLANRIVFGFDAIALSAIGTAVTQTQAASAAWNTAGADQFLDLLLSGAKVDALNQGYSVNTVAADPISWARLVASVAKLFAGAMDYADILKNGTILEIAGLSLMKTTNLPSGVKVLVADNTVLGSIGWEDLGGGYMGDPSNPLDVEVKRIRDDDRDGWKVQVRKTGVPMVQEPNAAVIVTGV